MANVRRDAIRPLSQKERRLLLDAVSTDRDRIMLRLLLETGRTMGELIGSRVLDLDLEIGALQLGKGENAIQYPLSSKTVAELKTHLKANPGKVYLFEGRCGKPVTAKWIRCVLEPLAQRAGVEDIYARV